jgi:hypothetical protein
VAVSVTTLPEATVVTALPPEAIDSVVLVAAANAGVPAKSEAQRIPRNQKPGFIPKAEIAEIIAENKDNSFSERIIGPFY